MTLFLKSFDDCVVTVPLEMAKSKSRQLANATANTLQTALLFDHIDGETLTKVAHYLCFLARIPVPPLLHGKLSKYLNMDTPLFCKVMEAAWRFKMSDLLDLIALQIGPGNNWCFEGRAGTIGAYPLPTLTEEEKIAFWERILPNDKYD